jgi:hypothetical protein
MGFAWYIVLHHAIWRQRSDMYVKLCFHLNLNYFFFQSESVLHVRIFMPMSD